MIRAVFTAAFLLVASSPAFAQVRRPHQHRVGFLRPERIKKIIDTAGKSEKIRIPEAYERPWEPGRPYDAGQVVRYAGGAYMCIQAHSTLPNWTPDIVPALWRLVRAPGEMPGDIPQWRQPGGVHDAYRLGEKVRHGGFVWKNAYDYNTWEPGEYGWEKVE